MVAQYTLAINHTEQRRIEIIAWGQITQDVVNIDNMDADEKERFGEWQHHNEMKDRGYISDCINNLNVDIGFDHDWCKRAYGVNRDTTRATEKWI